MTPYLLFFLLLLSSDDADDHPLKNATFDPSFAARERSFVLPPPTLHLVSAVEIEVYVPEDRFPGAEEAIMLSLEKTLRRAGIATVDNCDSEAPVLQVRILTLAEDDRYFYALLTDLTDTCKHANLGDMSVECILWSVPPMIGILERGQIDLLRSRSMHAVTQFLSSWKHDRKRASTSSNRRGRRLD